MEHQHQEKLPDQVAANISFSFTIPAIALKEEVNRAKGSCEDEGTEVTKFSMIFNYRREGGLKVH